MSTGIGKAGNVISVGDEVTTLGTVSAITGKGSKAVVTVVTHVGDTITAQANDCYGPQTDGPATSHSGKGFSVGDQVSVMGLVTAIAGSGQAAVLTTALKSSALVVKTTAVASHSPKKS